jgi:hypothetical protein
MIPNQEYLRKAADQAHVVRELAEKVKEGDEKKAAELEIEMERLAFYQASARGNAKERARKVIESAKTTVIGRAITQPLPKLK